jgi:hypothetical protein
MRKVKVWNGTTSKTVMIRDQYEEYTGLSDFVLYDLLSYVEYGKYPCTWITRCLENNFIQGCTQAGSENAPHLVALARFIYNRIPSEAWKTTEAIEKWCEAGGMTGKGWSREIY